MISKSRFAVMFFSCSIAMMGLWALLSFIQKQNAMASSGIVYVAPDGDCGEASPCFSEIQNAIDYVTDGDIIKVATGTYTEINDFGGTNQVVYINKSLGLEGGYNISNWDTSNPLLNPTVIDAQQMGRGIFITGLISVTVDGFSVTGGNATGQGGGVYRADGGGGIYVISSTVNIKHNDIYNNITNIAYGGGTGAGILLFASTATLSNNTIANNDSGNGSITSLV